MVAVINMVSFGSIPDTHPRLFFVPFSISLFSSSFTRCCCSSSAFLILPLLSSFLPPPSSSGPHPSILLSSFFLLSSSSLPLPRMVPFLGLHRRVPIQRGMDGGELSACLRFLCAPARPPQGHCALQGFFFLRSSSSSSSASAPSTSTPSSASPAAFPSATSDSADKCRKYHGTCWLPVPIAGTVILLGREEEHGQYNDHTEKWSGSDGLSQNIQN